MNHQQNYNLKSPENAPGSSLAKKRAAGFSLIELIFSMALTVMILGIVIMTFTAAMNTRSREASKTDAITSTQAALNILSREIGNSGYGLWSNGIVLSDSNDKKLHIRMNTGNSDGSTSAPGENITFYWDQASQSVVRYDAYGGGTTSGVINRVSELDFVYYNYNNVTGAYTSSLTPTTTTGRVTINLKVTLPNVNGQPGNQQVKVTSDVTLRNSPFMLTQY
jgi:Tfp pilus assembly protein PilW